MKYVDLIDVSTIAYEAVHGICGYKGKNLPAHKVGRFLEDDEDKAKFLSVFHSKMIGYASCVKSSSEAVLVVFDTFQNKSERFNILPTYKSDRDANKGAFNQSHFKKCLILYKTMLHEAGVFTVEVDRLEADDIIAHICINRGEKNIRINSRDSDLLQLLDANKFSNVVFFNPLSEKAYVHKDFNDKPEKTGSAMEDFFGDITTPEVDSWAKVIEKIDPAKMLLEKVITGDKTDTIPACVWYTKGVTRMNISDKRVEQALESYDGDIPENFDWDFVDKKFMCHLNEAVKTKKEPLILKSGNEEFKTAFEANMKMIKLDGSIIHDFAKTMLNELLEKIKASTDGIDKSVFDNFAKIETTGERFVQWAEQI